MVCELKEQAIVPTHAGRKDRPTALLSDQIVTWIGIMYLRIRLERTRTRVGAGAFSSSFV